MVVVREIAVGSPAGSVGGELVVPDDVWSGVVGAVDVVGRYSDVSEGGRELGHAGCADGADDGIGAQDAGGRLGDGADGCDDAVGLAAGYGRGGGSWGGS